MAPSEADFTEGEANSGRVGARWPPDGAFGGRVLGATKRRPRTPREPARRHAAALRKEVEAGAEEHDMAATATPPMQSHSTPDVLHLSSPTTLAGPLLIPRSLAGPHQPRPISGAAPAPNSAREAAPPTKGGISVEFQRCLEEELRRVAHDLCCSPAGGGTGEPDDKLNWHEAERQLIRWLFLNSGPFQWLRQHVELRLQGRGLGLEDALEAQRSEIRALSAQLQERDAHILRLQDSAEVTQPQADIKHEAELETRVADLSSSADHFQKKLDAAVHAKALLEARVQELEAAQARATEVQKKMREKTAAAVAAAAAAVSPSSPGGGGSGESKAALVAAQAQQLVALEAKTVELQRLLSDQEALATQRGDKLEAVRRELTELAEAKMHKEQAEEALSGQRDAEIEALHHEITERGVELSKAQRRQAEAEAALENRSRKLEEARAQARALEAAAQDAKARLAAKGHQLAEDVRRTFAEQVAKLAEREQKVEELEQKFAAQRAKLDTQASELQDCKGALEEQGGKLAEAQGHSQLLEAIVSECNRKLEEAQCRHHELEATVSERERRLEEAQRRHHELEATVSEREQGLEEAQCRHHELEATVSECKRQLEEFQHRHNELEATVSEHRRQLEEAQHRHNDLEASIKEHEQRLEEAQHLCQEMEAQASAREAEASARCKAAAAEVRKSQNRADEAEAENHGLQRRADKGWARVRELQAAFDRERAEGAESEAPDRTPGNPGLNNMLVQRLADLGKRLRTTEQEAAELRSKLHAREGQVVDTKGDSNRAPSGVDKLSPCKGQVEAQPLL